MAIVIPDFEKHFWSRVDIRSENECWEWTGTHIPNGYGSVSKNAHSLLTHRVAYELSKGTIPHGLLVLHSCDNPPCCNPNHLSVGTALDNNRDRNSKGRNADVRGEKNAMAKLTEWDVREIKFLLSQGFQQQDIAPIYKVSDGTIQQIAAGKTWKHVK